MEPLVSPSSSPVKQGLTKNKILIAIGGLLVVVVVGAYALNSSPNVYKGSIAEVSKVKNGTLIVDTSAKCTTGKGYFTIDEDFVSCVDASDLAALYPAKAEDPAPAAPLYDEHRAGTNCTNNDGDGVYDANGVCVTQQVEEPAYGAATTDAQQAMKKGDACTDVNGNLSSIDGKLNCAVAPKAGDVCTLNGRVKGIYMGQPATCVPLKAGDADVDGDKKDKVAASDVTTETDEPVVTENQDIGGPGGVTSASEEAAFRIQMLEQQLAIKKANEANMSQEEIAKQAQKAREEEAAAFAAAAQAARNKSLGIETPIAPEVAPASVPAQDVTGENATPIENPFAEAIANPIVDEALVTPTVDSTNSAQESQALQTESAAVKSANANTASENNSRAAAAATRVSKLHGAAIRGETGPEILLYPALLGLAQGAYLLIKRKK